MTTNKRHSFRVDQTLRGAFVLAARRLYGQRGKPEALFCGLNALDILIQHPAAHAFILSNSEEKREFECNSPLPVLRQHDESDGPKFETKVEVSSTAGTRDLIVRLHSELANLSVFDIPESVILRCACRLFTVIAPCLSDKWTLQAKFAETGRQFICTASELGPERRIGLPIVVAEPTVDPASSVSAALPVHEQSLPAQPEGDAQQGFKWAAIIGGIYSAGSGEANVPSLYAALSKTEHDFLHAVSHQYRSMFEENGGQPSRLNVGIRIQENALVNAAKSHFPAEGYQ